MSCLPIRYRAMYPARRSLLPAASPSSRRAKLVAANPAFSCASCFGSADTLASGERCDRLPDRFIGTVLDQDKLTARECCSAAGDNGVLRAYPEATGENQP